ncbi:MAG: hypothetical protein ALECFALPRED_004667 [Alectoria fallacina]|uniref:RRM domain-containing protein n=1 Tax=Alectoria fallacina TaxID=1903189 RepID=A0A8H3ENL1_9LECA|nr:MAG: hypothetical protein ALECFALPRED_004667 [Alectoria fallacina]
MGATLSFLGYASHQQPYSRYHEHVSQQLNCPSHGGPTIILGSGDAASPSIIDLCIRLAALKKDLQISRAGNTNKEAVIQYLLQSSVSNARVKQTTVQLKEQFLILKTAIDRTTKENEEIKDKLSKVEDTIFALSAPSVPNSRPQSTSTSFSSRSDFPPKGELATENLIDLLGCSQEADSAKLMEEDTTLLEEFYEDGSDIEGVFKNTTPDPSLHQFSDSEFEGSSYIVHFADSDEDAKPQDAIEVSTKKVRVPRGSSNFVTHTQQQNSLPELCEMSDVSSTESTSSPNGSNSIATSFNSTSSGLSPLNDVHVKLLEDSFSQLKALSSEGGNLNKSMAIVSTLASKLSSFGTSHHTEPSRTFAEALMETQDLQISVGDNTTEPQWSPERIFDSAQDRKTAVLINSRSAQAGEGDVPYPDFFKHGIRYVPKSHDQDVYRTVAISGLPPSITMMTLLEKVRGGMLVDVKLLDTAKITGSNTALVTFLHERSAMRYEQYAKKHPIAFGSIVAQVVVVSTPTWPIPINLRTGIEQFGRTRCFEVHHIPRKLFLSTIRQELTACPVMKSDSLECMRLGADGVLGLRFSSIRAAGHSSALFSKTPRYRGCTVQCIPDPCAQPLETLLEQRTDISEAIEEDTLEPANNSEAAVEKDTDGLTRVDWKLDSEPRRGRGFEDRAISTTDSFVDLAGHRIFSDSVSAQEPLRQETAASIASFAKSFCSPE